MREATRAAREEARQVVERDRAEARGARSSRRAERSAHWGKRADLLTVRLRGAGLELRRRLGPLGRRLSPAGRGAESMLSRVAPLVSGALMLVVRIPAALIAILLDLVLDVGGWVRSRIGPLSAGLADLALRSVTPVRALAFVASGAAVALAGSQFADYRGVAIGADAYEGEIGAVAPAPFTDLEAAGSAHMYALVPLAVLALVLIVATARGRWRLGRAVGLIGVAGIVISIVIDAPHGLDAGRSGVAYLGTDARLIEGFWAQVASSAALAVCGPLLGLYAKREAAAHGKLALRRRRPRSRRAATPRHRPSEAST